ncbi:hypothetical protein PISL3812_00686 [Talaromyces islandicus]|uniref:6-phosphogluconate dehydrogenase NADP-binding domain-containing protein n=1 Tax=Talaromyces islandicus TaxID=28573 RepID=A0A0U1LK53_TALIS|nr:hypothetical protein PISL3812_00686 [Talaromyces islandicus]
MSLFATYQVGWIGLGSMGLAMATRIQDHLQAQGLPGLHYFNRTASRGQQILERGAIQCQSIAELVQKSSVICISMSDDNALKNIIQQISSTDSDLETKTIVDTTTVHPDTTKEVAALLSQRGASFVAAPVFGTPPNAEKGELMIALAGPRREFLNVLAQSFRDVIAQDVLIVSDLPEKAALLKTLGNFVVAGIMEIISEAHVLAEKSGLDSQLLESFLGKKFGDAVHSDSSRLTTGVYIPAKGQKATSDLHLAIKDVQHGIDSAEAVGTRLKVAEVAMENLKRARDYSDAHGGRALDSSSLYGIVREDAGLDFRNDIVRARPEEEEH